MVGKCGKNYPLSIENNFSGKKNTKKQNARRKLTFVKKSRSNLPQNLKKIIKLEEKGKSYSHFIYGLLIHVELFS